MLKKAIRFIQSPANWVGLGLATPVLALHGAGIIGAWWGAMALAGYVAGFGVGATWFGKPNLSDEPWQQLEFKDEGDARVAMEKALTAVEGLVDFNPEGRLSKPVQAKVKGLCAALENLLHQWERTKGSLSLEEGFTARHIALTYLPDALKTYLSIPAKFATSKVLGNGQTAEQTFLTTLDELDHKVQQLTDDLASQDAEAFLVHSKFLSQKFAGSQLEAPSLSIEK